MKINWKVRLRNKNFWLTLIPAALLLAEKAAALLGMDIELDSTGKELCSMTETLFLILGILGIINDPTTKGLSDSARALGYENPG